MDLASYLPPAWVVWAVGGMCAVAATWMMVRALIRALRSAWIARRKAQAPRDGKTATPATLEDWLTWLVAGIATGVSSTGMWKFARDVLELSGPLQVLLFAFIEFAIVISALRAKRSMRDNFKAGLDGVAVWGLACLTAVLSALDSEKFGEVVFRLAAPLVAAWLWERGMRLERHRMRGTKGINWRLTPARILVLLGVAEANERTASEVDVHRRLTRIALAAKKVHQLRTSGAKPRKVTAAVVARDRALDQAVANTDLATNPATQSALLDLVTTLGGAENLSGILGTARAPWAHLDHPAVTGAVRHSEAVELAAALDRNTAARLRADEAELVADEDRSATDPATGRGDDSGPLEVAAGAVPVDRAGRSWLTTLVPWSRPVAIEARDHEDDRPSVAEAVAETVANGASNGEVVATGRGPVADRKRPDEQDKRRAIRFYIGRAKKLNPPSKRVLAEWTGFSETWALGCIQEGQQQMTEQGWTFDDRGTPTPPPEVAEPVATTSLPATANGDQS
ncbi:hypothetical protein [Nonomuraea sp. NPDC049129]|uniref:hypothetical protein n=1 Tax=Nonomuraea sp. NPDC049129 TaxID=3155272 RepID=UPI00340A137C